MSISSLEFFKNASIGINKYNRVSVFSIRVKGEHIAAAICLIDQKMVEYYITTYDANWGQFSPGKVLISKIAAWAFEHGRNFDFRIGATPYKQSWSNAERNVVSLSKSCTMLGMLPILKLRAIKTLKKFRHAISGALPSGVLDYIKALEPRRS